MSLEQFIAAQMQRIASDAWAAAFSLRESLVDFLPEFSPSLDSQMRAVEHALLDAAVAARNPEQAARARSNLYLEDA